MKLIKVEFLNILETYIWLLTRNLDEIFEPEVVSRFPQKRELIDQGIEEFSIEDDYLKALQKADLILIQNIEEVLDWMQKEVTFEVREKYKDEIKKEQWYWWLDEIFEGKYPLKMIPEYLRDEISRLNSK